MLTRHPSNFQNICGYLLLNNTSRFFRIYLRNLQFSVYSHDPKIFIVSLKAANNNNRKKKYVWIEDVDGGWKKPLPWRENSIRTI